MHQELWSKRKYRMAQIHFFLLFCLYKVSGSMQYTISGNKLWYLKLVIQRRPLILESGQTALHKMIK